MNNQTQPKSQSQINESSIFVDDKPTMSKGISKIIFGGTIAGLGAVLYNISQQTYIVIRYYDISGYRFPYQAAERTYEFLAIPGIIGIAIGIIGIIIGILTYIKSDN